MGTEGMARDGRRGSVWIMLVFLIIAAWTAMAASLSMMASQYRSLNRQNLTSAALCLAESGVAKALWELSRDPAYGGEADTKLDVGTFSVVVRGDEVVATGYVPSRLKAVVLQTVTVKIGKGGGGLRPLSWRRR